MRLTDAIHETGAKIAGQLGHAGPVANGRSNGVHALAVASRMPSPLSMQMIKSATAADITRVTKDYVRTARITVDAGFDAVEMHLGHGYLLSSFLAPDLNRRRDRWGGTLDNRARFARDVAAVRDEVGGAIAVTAKMGWPRGRRGLRVSGIARGRPPVRGRRPPRRARAEGRELAARPDVFLPR